MAERASRNPLAFDLQTPAGVESRTVAQAIIAFLQERYGATVDTEHDADGDEGSYVIHINANRVERVGHLRLVTN